MGVKPDGKNINDACGATDTKALQAAVIEYGADIGIALDGDADRLIMVDETGAIVDGDQLMAAMAVALEESGRLAGDTLVTTVMSNLGLERFLESKDIKMLRTGVGDRYVTEAMRDGGFSLGGEQSGHIILSEYSTTGDGLLAALQVLKILKESGKKASEALSMFEQVPQVLKNVRFEAGEPLEDEGVIAAIEKAESVLANDGRLLVRASGTEPLIRVMAEGDDEARVEAAVDSVCDAVQRVAG